MPLNQELHSAIPEFQSVLPLEAHFFRCGRMSPFPSSNPYPSGTFLGKQVEDITLRVLLIAK